MFVQTYLLFDGRCEEALDFYTSALGARIHMLMRHKDSPVPAAEGMLPPGSENKIMHVTFQIEDTVLMASDGRCAGNPQFTGFSLSLGYRNASDARAAFARLADGGTVHMPLSKTFWSPLFGIVVDRFGVSWMFNLAQQ